MLTILDRLAKSNSGQMIRILRQTLIQKYSGDVALGAGDVIVDS